MPQDSKQHVTMADRAAETLRPYEQERQERPAWRARAYDRLIARIIDVAIILGASMVIFYALTAAGAFGDTQDATGQTPVTERQPRGAVQPQLDPSWGPVMPSLRDALSVLGLLAVLAAYDIVTTRLLGATPGKRILGLRVHQEDGEPLQSTSRPILRTVSLVVPLGIALAMWFTSILFAWGSIAILLIMLWRAMNPNSDGQTLHDRLAGTDVADARQDATA